MATPKARPNPVSRRSHHSQPVLPADSKVARYNLGLPFSKEVENANSHFMTTFTSMWEKIRLEDPTAKLVHWIDPLTGKYIEDPDDIPISIG